MFLVLGVVCFSWFFLKIMHLFGIFVYFYFCFVFCVGVFGLWLF